MSEKYFLNSNICPECGGKNEVWRELNTEVGEYETHYSYCACSIEASKKEKLEIERAKKVYLKEKYNKLFPFLDCDEDIKAHRFDNFEIVKGTEKAFNEAKKSTLNYFGGYGINFIGACGSGKTRLLKTIGYESCLTGKAVIFVEYARIFDRIFATINSSNESKSELTQCLKECDILLVDELGVGTNTPAKEDCFLDILNERARKRLVTHFTMNPDGQGALSERVKSRLKEYALPIILNAPDYRPKVLREKIKRAQGEKRGNEGNAA